MEKGGKAYLQALSVITSLVVGVTGFRMKTGHEYFAKHLHRNQVPPFPDDCLLYELDSMNAETQKNCTALDRTARNEEELTGPTALSGSWVRLELLF